MNSTFTTASLPQGHFTKTTTNNTTGKYWWAGLGFLMLMMSSMMGWGQGSENFTNIPTTSTGSYLDRSWTGTNSVTWVATAARTDQTLNGKAICTNGDGKVTSPTYTGGMGTLTFNYVRGFTGSGARSIEVFVNGNKIGSTITVNPTSNTVQNYSSSINITGNVVLELRTSGTQIIIDDIVWTAASASLSPPTLIAASGATVDAPFDVTFTNANSWASNITGITVGGTTLAAGAYIVGTNKVTFTPGASTLLQSAGTKSIVVSATGFSTSTVSQAIAAGAATKLSIATALVAPTTNGGTFATQPVIVIQDQYANTTTSTANVNATVGAGTWTIGGTTTRAGVAGTATFTNLTATSAAAVTGATIIFTSTGLTSVTSAAFNIPAPAPANDLCANAITLAINGTASAGTMVGSTNTTNTFSYSSSSNDVWYKFTPSVTGSHTLTLTFTTASNRDIDVDIFTIAACPTTGTANFTAHGSTNTETITGSFTAGTTYYVRVIDFGSANGGVFSIAVTTPQPVISANGTNSLTFANQTQLTSSASQSFNLSGTDLTGFPGNITVSAPNPDFQVSNNNSTWGAATTIAYTSATLASTLVYVRFTPQASGAKTGNVSFSGGGVSAPPTIAVSGTGVITAPVATAATSITNNSFIANWGTVAGTTEYRIDVYTGITNLAEDFDDGNFTANPIWAGNTADYAISTASTLPSGLASTDGSFLASNSNVSNTILYTSSNEVSEWKFSLGSPTFDPSGGNFFGVVLMSSTVISGDITTAPFNGYYLKIGANGSADKLELWRSTNTTKTKVGDFASSPTFEPGALQDGLNIRITRSAAGLFSFFYSTGFLLSSTPSTSGGTLTDNTYSASSYFGVFTNFGSTSTIRRVYIDNIILGTQTFVPGYQNLSVAGTSQSVTGLSPTTQYSFVVRAVDANSTSANSNTITATTYTNAITNADFQTKASGFFSNPLLWQYNTGSAGFVDANQVPTSTNNITVLNGHQLVLNADYTVGAGKTFTIATGGSLLINPTNNLEMANATSAINFNGQSVTVRSGSGGTGSIGKMLGTLSGATNVTVERYIPVNAFRAYRLLSVPTSGQTIKAAWQEGLSNGTPGTNNLGTQITGGYADAVSNRGFDAITPGTSMFSYNAAAKKYDAILNTTTQINDQQGWLIYIRGDRRDNATNTSINPTTLRTTGTLKFGTLAPVSVAANQYAVVGNPYASAIDLRQLSYTGTAVGTNITVWDPKLSSVGGYQLLTFDGTNYRVVTGGGSYGAIGNVVNIIQSGQAFFIEAGSVAGSVTIGESSKVTGSVTSVFRPSSPAATNQDLYVNLYSISGGVPKALDGVLVSGADANSNAIDNFDASKQNNFSENLGLKSQGVNLSIERRKPFVNNDTVFLTTTSLRRTTYQLYFKGVDLDPNVVATLEDNYLNTKAVVNPNGNSAYDFTVDANAASAATDRFRVVFKELGSGPLPVTFTNIKAAEQGNNIAVEWKVGSQLNISSYDVEKSTDGRSFTKVATIQAGNTTTYNWLDVAAIQGNNFYRVRATDINIGFKYTQIVKITLGKKGSAIAVSPNPVQGSMLNLQFTNQAAGKYQLRLINAAGQQVYTNTLQHLGGSSSQTITLSSQIIRGVYQLDIVAPDKTRKAQKLIVE